jgi:transcriptional regulator with XRE-family HTH domain
MASEGNASERFEPINQADVAGEIGRRVRARREAIGISQERLGHLVGLHYSTVSHIERGDRGLRVISILRLAEGLACDPGELLAGINAPPREKT